MTSSQYRQDRLKPAAPPADHPANDKLLEFLRKSFKVSKKTDGPETQRAARQTIVEIIYPITSPDVLLSHP